MLTGKKNGYLFGYSKNLFMRKSCYDCLFRKIPRNADLTFADFWGLEDKYPKQWYNGLSCLLVNSKKGKDYFRKFQNSIVLFEEDISILKTTHKKAFKSIKIPENRKSFFNDICNKNFKYIVNAYLSPPLIHSIKGFYKRHFNSRTILFFKKILRFWRSLNREEG